MGHQHSGEPGGSFAPLRLRPARRGILAGIAAYPVTTSWITVRRPACRIGLPEKISRRPITASIDKQSFSLLALNGWRCRMWSRSSRAARSVRMCSNSRWIFLEARPLARRTKSLAVPVGQHEFSLI